MWKIRFGVCQGMVVWWPIVTLKFKLWKGQKLNIIILLHIGLVTSTFTSPKTRKAFMFRISGSVGHVLDPRNHYPGLWTTKLFKMVQEVPNTILIFEIWQSQKMETLEKKRARIPWYPSYKFLKILNMGSRFFKNMRLKSWISVHLKEFWNGK